MRALPFDAASFDGALAMYSLIFLPKQEVTAVLSVLARFLRPRGVLLMAVQGGAPAEVGEPNLFSVMTPEEIRGYLDVAGFEVVHEWIRAPYAHERPFNKIYLLARKRGNAAF
jgi:ubiquinone/menaquinone biosynthesis C-methylase UbiE